VIDASSTTVSLRIRFPGFGWSRAAPRGLNLNPPLPVPQPGSVTGWVKRP
jgi:hypothetical protein